MIRSLALPLLLAAPLAGLAVAEQTIPAGSLIKCTIDDKLSSKTVAVGDPILCQVSHSEVYGRSQIPYGSYLVGRFADYKDPGHFVGKGWVELKFERLVLQPDTIVPVNARVVQVPKYPVDADGRIHGTGHTTRDIVEWAIPVLWPIDLIELPRRGPRVVLKSETQLTLRVMDDLGIPTELENAHQQGLIARNQQQYPDQVAPPFTPYAPQQQSYPQQQPYQQPYQQQQSYAQQGYAPQQQQPPQTVIYNNYATPSAYQQPQTVVVQGQPQVQYVPVPVPRRVYVTPPPYGYVPYGYPPRYYAPY